MSEQYSPEPRRGRPTNAEREAKAAVPVRAEEVQRQRRRRESLGDDRHMKLGVPEDKKDPNFTYRWFNETPGRLESKTVHDDWDIVKESVDPTKDNGEGTAVRRPVGVTPEGKTLYAYLCKKPKDWYQEDKAKEQKLVNDIEEGLRQGEAQGAEALAGPHAYVPGGRNTIKHGE